MTSVRVLVLLGVIPAMVQASDKDKFKYGDGVIILAENVEEYNRQEGKILRWNNDDAEQIYPQTWQVRLNNSEKQVAVKAECLELVPLNVGDGVLLDHVKGDLNGMPGKIVGWDANADRWLVELEDSTTRKILPQSLIHNRTGRTYQGHRTRAQEDEQEPSYEHVPNTEGRGWQDGIGKKKKDNRSFFRKWIYDRSRRRLAKLARSEARSKKDLGGGRRLAAKLARFETRFSDTSKRDPPGRRRLAAKLARFEARFRD